MLTTEQIDAIRDRLELITEPINKFLISDICRRIMEAGQATSTAEYQARRARALKLTPKQLAEFLAKEVPKESKEYKELYRQVSDLVYKQTYRHIGMNPQDEWESLAAVADIFSGMAEQGLFNIVQTLGMVDVYGNTLPLRDVYINNSDYAFRKVQAGAQSYQEAVKDAIANIADYGVRFIDYESGRRDSLDVAVRINVFGGMGLMVEQVQNKAHDEAGCDGWEVSAHEACAKDHEPYQGRQFTDNEFMKLNGTPENPGILKRRFSTLNCKHVAFPIILGVNQPQYTKEQLEDMKKRNEDGVTYQGKHYTSYEATQMQRKLERTIRKQRRKVLAYESAGLDSSAIKTRLTALNARYSDFSQAAGIKTQPQRLEVLGYGPKQLKGSAVVIPNTINNSEGAVRTYAELMADANEAKLLTDKYLPNILSAWKGDVVINNNISPGKLWDCNITLNSTSNFHQILHEMLHAKSVSLYKESIAKQLFVQYSPFEESSVEFLTKSILRAEGLEIIESGYDGIYNALCGIKAYIRPQMTDIEFGQELFNVKLGERSFYLYSECAKLKGDERKAAIKLYNEIYDFKY